MQQIRVLINKGIVELLIETIDNNNNNRELKLIKACLEGLENLLNTYASDHRVPMAENEIIMRIYQMGGFPIIEGLQNHQDNTIYQITSRIIDNHFETVPS